MGVKQRNTKHTPIIKAIIYKSGDVAKLIGCSPRTACKMLDSHTDLVYRIRQDRRITRENLVTLLARENLTVKQLGWVHNPHMAWIGSAMMKFIRRLDEVLNPFQAVSKIISGEVNAIACINHTMTADEIESIVEICERLGCRCGVRLPDDKAEMKRKTEFAWLFVDGVDVCPSEVVQWVRGEEK